MSRARNSRRVAVGLLGAVAALTCVTLLVKAAITQPAVGSWNTASSLSQPRAGASSVLLQSGQILITGGDNGSGPSATADLVSPTDGSISAAAPMLVARENHISVTLQNGQVLVAGGVTTGGAVTNEAELYDPTSNSWSSVAGGMVEARAGATATLLQNGEVLIADGAGNNGVVSSTAEVFDPNSASDGSSAFTIVSGSLSSPRENAAAALLGDGRVLIAGGSNGSAPLATTDIYDPATATIAAGPAMSSARQSLSATTLLNGLVLVAGGSNGSQDLASLELFDPSANSGAGGFSPALDVTGNTVSLVVAREGQQAILLPHNGSVLIFGGTSSGVAQASAELFTGSVTSSDTWSYADAATGAMTAARSDFTAASFSNGTGTSVDDGLLLAFGGKDASGSTLASAELYGFSWVKTDQYEYSPGSTANITGGGFQPGETVQMTLVESPYVDNDGPVSAVADSSGNISAQLLIDSQDAGVTFYLTAIGQASGREAQAKFADVVFCGGDTCIGVGGGCTATANWTVPNPMIAQGTTSVALSGKLTVTCGSTTYYPASTDSISATISGTTASGTLLFSDTSGDFGGTMSGTGSLAASSYTITYDFASQPNTAGSYLVGYSTTSTLTVQSGTTLSTPTLSVTNSPVTYNGSAQSATVTASYNSTSVAGTVSNVEYNGSPTAPTSAGTYAVTADFTPTDTSTYATLTNASAGNFVIQQATPTLSVSNSPVTYNGTAQSATVTGSVAGTVSNIEYGGSTTAPTSAGTYAVTASFTPADTTDYATVTGESAGSFVIQQASSTVTVTCPTTVQTYTGLPLTPCSAAATGAGGLDVTNLTVAYTNNTNPGTATASATYNGDVNHTGNTGTATFQIGDNFVGLLSPYAPPPATFNVKRTMPLAWQYTDANGNAINSSAANPQVLISIDSACTVASASSSTDTITLSSAGSSGYQYDSTTNTWQFNWQVKGNPDGCYAIYIKNGQTGQVNGPFLISVTSH